MRYWRSRAARAAVFSAFSLAVAAPSVRAEDDGRRALRITPVVRVFQEVSPAVVNISTTSIVSYRQSFGINGIFEDIFDFPFETRPRQFKATSVGSGFVIQRDGYVVTNAHVVARTVERKISFADGTELNASVVAIDPDSDLAVLKVDAPKPLPFVRIGRSDDLMPGETVIVIGNPMGYKHTVTTGVVSAVDRELDFGEGVTYRGLIQTDAPINPGNSGGPLLNILGELIGINTAIRGDAQNIGFAIPVERMHEQLPQILDLQRMRRVAFGAHFGPDRVGEGADAGVYVRQVDAGSPAAAAGLSVGDRVTAIDRRPTPHFIEAFAILEEAPTATPMTFEVVPPKGDAKTISLALADVPKPDGAKLMFARLGLGIHEMTDADLRKLGMRRPFGLIVDRLKTGSQAADEGVLAGDVLTKVGGHPVDSLEAVGSLLENVVPGDRVLVGILRIGRESSIQVELPLRAQ